MRLLILNLLLGLLCLPAWSHDKFYKPHTQRAQAQYLSTESFGVEDTCPGHDIFNQFVCTKAQLPGFTCFDVYRVQGDPLDNERYTLLDQTLTEENTSAEPLCTFENLTCADFLKTLNYNLDFSWFIANFPSSSFPECGETYSCTRIACLKPLEPAPDGTPRSQKLSCVFKKNQFFFLGTPITCEDKNAPAPKKKTALPADAAPAAK